MTETNCEDAGARVTLKLPGTGEHHLLKAVIFDFDGVILESVDIKTDAFVQLFEQYPEHRDKILQYHLNNLGISRFRKFEWIFSELLNRPLDEEQSRLLGKAFSDIVFEKIISCPYVPGARDLLGELKSRCLLFVASGTPQEELERIIEAKKLSPFFTGVWGTPRTKVEIIESILTEFKLDTQEVLFVGDGISDYDAAKELGILFLARETGELGKKWKEIGVMTVPDLAAALPLLSSTLVVDRS